MLFRSDWYARLADDHHGTVNVQAMDTDGNVACAVSTSGTALKFPGRLGDSPIIGAGNYCDNRYGAAACTGRGELSIRASTARSLIHFLAEGLGVEAAARRAMKDVHALSSYGAMNCLLMDAHGNTVSATTVPVRASGSAMPRGETMKPMPRSRTSRIEGSCRNDAL